MSVYFQLFCILSAVVVFKRLGLLIIINKGSFNVIHILQTQQIKAT